MTVLGLDIGDKRVGVAYELQGVVFPYKVLIRANLIKDLKKIIVEKKVTSIVVGVPYGMSEKNTQQKKIQDFIVFLRETFPKVSFIEEDERYSTQISSNLLEEFGQDASQKKDDIAATYILESYLIRKNKTS